MTLSPLTDPETIIYTQGELSVIDMLLDHDRAVQWAKSLKGDTPA